MSTSLRVSITNLDVSLSTCVTPELKSSVASAPKNQHRRALSLTQGGHGTSRCEPPNPMILGDVERVERAVVCNVGEVEREK